MSTDIGPSLFPLHRCKTIHLVRHAQGIHNVEGEDFKGFMSPEYLDARLTPLGWQQVENLRNHVQSCGLDKKIELVIMSPLMRTLQTASGVFGGESLTDKMDVVPLMVENAGKTDHAAISSLGCPPFIALDLCRERMKGHPCDKRKNISEYQLLFPAIDFSQIETEEDKFWKPDRTEPREETVARGLKLINWLWTRKEKEIAIVSHGGFLCHTLSAFGNDCHPLMKKKIHEPFSNCELRSMVIVNRGSDTSTKNYLGRNLVVDKNIEEGPDSRSAI